MKLSVQLRTIWSQLKNNQTRYFPPLLTGIFAVFTGYVASFHEPWMDEAQAWLVARDLGPLGILDQMSYEGTGALWHFILFPFAHLGLPYWTMTAVSVAIATAAVFVFLRYAPFSWLMKILVIGSWYFAWEYAVIARSYGLSALLIFCLAAIWQKRFEKPWLFAVLVALLAQTNGHSLFIAAVLGAVYLVEAYKKGLNRYFYPLALMLASGLAAVFQAYPDPDHYTYLVPNAYEAPKTIINFLLAGDRLFIEPISWWISAGVFIFLLATFIRYPRQFFILIGSCAGLAWTFIYSSPNGGAPRHWALILVLFLFAYWTSTYETPLQVSQRIYAWISGPKGRGWALVILQLAFFLTWQQTLEAWRIDIDNPFSHSKATAEYIQEHYMDEPIVALNAGITTPILPYLDGKEFYYVQFERWGTFQTKSSDWGPDAFLPPETFLARLEKAFPDESPILLMTFPIDDPEEAMGYEEVFRAEEPMVGYGWERYYIYAPIE